MQSLCDPGTAWDATYNPDQGPNASEAPPLRCAHTRDADTGAGACVSCTVTHLEAAVASRYRSCPRLPAAVHHTALQGSDSVSNGNAPQAGSGRMSAAQPIAGPADAEPWPAQQNQRARGSAGEYREHVERPPSPPSASAGPPARKAPVITVSGTEAADAVLNKNSWYLENNVYIPPEGLSNRQRGWVSTTVHYGVPYT